MPKCPREWWAEPTLLALLNEHASSLFVPDQNVGTTVPGNVCGDNLHPHAGVFVGLVADPFHRLVGVALQFEPVDDRRGRRVDVALGAVGEVALAGDDVLEAVAV